jgi:hypothetical protein
MDDIRRPQRPIRRDYAIPAHRPQPAPYHPQPVNHTPGHHAQHTPAVNHQVPQPQPAVPQRPQLAPEAHYQTSKTKRRGKMITVAVSGLLAGAAIFSAGWVLKGSSSSQTIPQSITRQVNFSLYFPSPMPAGYTYMKDTATFQIGQVYYKFADGSKRVTVMEQPMPAKRPNLSLMSGYNVYNSPIGKAAVGDSFGQATAVVLTPSTVITLHSVGSVSQDELKTAISNMKNIGQNPKNT